MIVGGEKVDDIPQEWVLYRLGDFDKRPPLDIPHILLDAYMVILSVVEEVKEIAIKNSELARTWQSQNGNPH